MVAALIIAFQACIILVFGYRILRRRLAVTTTLAWVLVVAALPFIGLGIYFIFGDTKLDDKRRSAGARLQAVHLAQFGVNAADAPIDRLNIPAYFKDVSQSIADDIGFHISENNQIKLFTLAEEMFNAIITDIDGARHTVELEFFTVDPQGRVEDVIAALERAAARGVSCRVLVDQVGSKEFLEHNFKTRLEDAGVEIIISLQINLIEVFLKRKDLRNHRKMILIDLSIAYTGSFNLIDPKYFKSEEAPDKWVDILMRLEGHVVGSLATILHTDFICDRGDLDAQTPDPSAKYYERQMLSSDAQAVIQVVPSGPEMHPSLIYNLIVSAIFGAQNSITVITPYFVPDDAFLLALVTAAKRGREVTLIIPKTLVSSLVKYSGQASFSVLLEAGVKIMWFKDDMVHTKALLIDDNIALVGTVNMDIRSFYLNLELTLMIYDTEFAAKMAEVAQGYLENCEQVEREAWENRSKIDRLREDVCRLAAPIL